MIYFIPKGLDYGAAILFLFITNQCGQTESGKKSGAFMQFCNQETWQRLQQSDKGWDSQGVDMSKTV